jgi:hypothetical protein
MMGLEVAVLAVFVVFGAFAVAFAVAGLLHIQSDRKRRERIPPKSDIRSRQTRG